MEFFPVNIRILIRRLGLLMGIYSVCRLLFLIFNYTYFSAAGLYILLKCFFFGLRYDITIIVITNILFIALHLLPFQFFYKKKYQNILLALYLLVNIPLIFLNCIDFGLFSFTGKRSGSEIFSILSFGNDFINTAPNMVLDFWYLLIVFFVLVFILKKKYPRIQPEPVRRRPLNNLSLKKIIKTTLLLIFFTGLTIIGFRGGVQYKPLNILSASRYSTGRTTALILNTPFTVIKTFGKKTLEEVRWMTDEQALKISPVIHFPESKEKFNPKNVVVIILEGFGKEYIGSLNSYEGYTPFLDSLVAHSYVCTNAYANGKRSIEGIPAIISGFPALMSDPFISSAYSGNTVTSISSLLKSKNYTTEFFHGGTNGTMGFDNFSKLSGFDHYFGRTEYNDDNDFDGSWGIYDEPFLQRTASELNKMKAPFFAAIFTISSHHPYSIPEKFSGRFPKGTLPIHQSIRYADYSLQQFFESASHMPFFRNTLFVITADHTALTEHRFYMNRIGLFSIPILYYSPDDSLLTGKHNRTTQQIDILPSIMDYLNYESPYFAFGKSVFNNSEDAFSINYIDENYQLINEKYSFMMDTIAGNSLYNYSVDSLLKINLSGLDTVTEKLMTEKLKGFVQNYNRIMIRNEMKYVE